MSFNVSWDERNLAEGRWFRTSLGPLNVIVLNRHDEWRISSWPGKDEDHDLPAEGAVDELPIGLEWERWDCNDQDRRVQIRPAFPDLPVIAKPHASLTLAGNGQALFYAGIPASLEVLAECEGSLSSLVTIPTDPLSKTWHGTRSEGHVCYSLRTRARRFFEAGDWPEHDIVVAVDLKNDRSEPFVFDRLFLDLGHFSIFEQDQRLWGNGCRIKIDKDDDHANDVTYAPKPLEPAAEARELTPARAGKTRRSKFQKAFDSFVDVIH